MKFKPGNSKTGQRKSKSCLVTVTGIAFIIYTFIIHMYHIP